MNTTETPSMEIDVLSLLKKLWMKKFLILFMALFFGTLALLGSVFLIKPSYSASTRIYVINQQNAENITATDLQALQRSKRSIAIKSKKILKHKKK